jgi:hypothetical protein
LYFVASTLWWAIYIIVMLFYRYTKVFTNK